MEARGAYIDVSSPSARWLDTHELACTTPPILVVDQSALALSIQISIDGVSFSQPRDFVFYPTPHLTGASVCVYVCVCGCGCEGGVVGARV